MAIRQDGQLEPPRSPSMLAVPGDQFVALIAGGRGHVSVVAYGMITGARSHRGRPRYDVRVGPLRVGHDPFWVAYLTEPVGRLTQKQFTDLGGSPTRPADLQAHRQCG